MGQETEQRASEMSAADARQLVETQQQQIEALLKLAKGALASSGNVAAAAEAEREARERAARCEKEVRRMRRDNQAAKDAKGVNFQLDILEDSLELLKELVSIIDSATVLSISDEVAVDSESIKRTDLLVTRLSEGQDGGRMLATLGRLEKLLADRERDLKFVMTAPSASDGYRALAVMNSRAGTSEVAKTDEGKLFEAALKEIEAEKSKAEKPRRKRNYRDDEFEEYSERRGRHDGGRYDRQSLAPRSRGAPYMPPRGSYPGMAQEVPLCHACGRPGHFARNCTMNRGPGSPQEQP